MKMIDVHRVEINEWPEAFMGFKVETSTGEIVPVDVDKNFYLMFINKGNLFEYYLYCPRTMDRKDGWYTASPFYMTIDEAIDTMSVPFKVRHQGFKSWLN